MINIRDGCKTVRGMTTVTFSLDPVLQLAALAASNQELQFYGVAGIILYVFFYALKPLWSYTKAVLKIGIVIGLLIAAGYAAL